MKKTNRVVAVLACAAVSVTCYGAAPVYADGVALNEANFPDDNFRACIARDYDSDGNGYLDSNEMSKAGNIYCENSGVYSVKGIEFFPNAIGLWCKNNNISELDLSGNPNLTGIWCSGNPLTELDLSPCPKLEWVYCFDCKLTSLDTTGNPEMAFIECNDNEGLKSIDVSRNPKLEHLFASKCGLTSLDLSNNPRLCQLSAAYNDLRSIDLSNNPDLKRLDIWYNERLGNVDVSGLSGLQYFACAKTGLSKLDVTHNHELVDLRCSYNHDLTTLDLSQNPKLALLNVEIDTGLRKLDLSHNPRLYHLYAYGMSSMDSIDISKNFRLCKAYNEGVYRHHLEDIGRVYSMTLDYGGSEEPFDDLKHIVAFDDDMKINANFNAGDVPDSVIDTNDGHSGSELFATRGDAVQLLYEVAGSPAVDSETRFTDVVGTKYEAAVKWAEMRQICFGYPNICYDTFCPDELITRQDFALMAHRCADALKLGTAFDYGRTDWFDDFYDIDFYAWGPFTWAYQFKVIHVDKGDTRLYPHGRITRKELIDGVAQIFDLDPAASYAQRTDGTSQTGSSAKPAVNPAIDLSKYPTSTTPAPISRSHNITDPKGMTYEFVNRIYKYVLNREPEADGAEFWSDELWTFRRSGAEVAFGFIFSPEFEARNTSDEEFVTILYKTFFGRDPERGGMEFWTSKLYSGEMDRMAVASGFIFSQEWADTCASYGIRSGGSVKPVAVIEPTGLTFAFVERMYTTALGRECDEEGKKFWASELSNFNTSGEACGAFFFLSDEMKGFKLSDKEFISRLYATFMDREADKEGEAFWLGVLYSGKPRADVVLGFTRSPEFVQKCIDARILPY